jgi:hypothetical protein
MGPSLSELLNNSHDFIKPLANILAFGAVKLLNDQPVL